MSSESLERLSWYDKRSQERQEILFVAIKRGYFKILVQNHLDCIRVARDVLFLGSGGSVPQKVPFKASLVGEFNHYVIGIQQPES